MNCDLIRRIWRLLSKFNSTFCSNWLWTYFSFFLLTAQFHGLLFSCIRIQIISNIQISSHICLICSFTAVSVDSLRCFSRVCIHYIAGTCNNVAVMIEFDSPRLFNLCCVKQILQTYCNWLDWLNFWSSKWESITDWSLESNKTLIIRKIYGRGTGLLSHHGYWQVPVTHPHSSNSQFPQLKLIKNNSSNL